VAALHYTGENLYRNNPQWMNLSYRQQQDVLFAEAFMYSNAMTSAMARMGHDVHEVVYDLRPMQETWAREQGISYRPESWQSDILLKQIEKLRPDVLYFQGTDLLPDEYRDRLKEIFPFLQLVVLYTGSSGFKTLRNIDLLLLGIPATIDHYRAKGLNAQIVYHGFDARIHDKLAAAGLTENRYASDFSFIGSSGFGHYYPHSTRYWDLLGLLGKTDIGIWADEQEQVHSRILKCLEEFGYEGDTKMLSMWMTGLCRRPTDIDHFRKMLPSIPGLIQKALDENRQGRGLPLLSLRYQYPDRVHPPLHGLKMYDLIRRSKICLNIHMDRTCGSACNMRLFEATGMGSCLLTDSADNMRNLFEPDREVVTFASMEECIEKMNYLRDHEEVRRQIAFAGQKRAFRDHTMDQRARQVDSAIQALLGRGRPIEPVQADGHSPTLLQTSA
jgi:spore maturation protein CgeB